MFRTLDIRNRLLRLPARNTVAACGFAPPFSTPRIIHHRRYFSLIQLAS
jgi:hypothetical protein